MMRGLTSFFESHPMHTTLITVTELSHLLERGERVRIFDCSGDLMNPPLGLEMFLKSHLPGAHYADVQGDLCGSVADGINAGRHPLPPRERVAEWMGQHGVDNHTQVVVYDQQQANYCARLWWLLKWCGHEAVAVLDGGLAAWQAAGHAVSSGPAEAVPACTLALRDARVDWLTTQQVAASLGKGPVIVDARARPRYLGETEPLDPVAGHIPGARNRPFQLNLQADGLFKPAAQLREEFLALLAGQDPAQVIHQCGSGISAIPNLLAMEVAGLGRARLYPGSWSEWCNTPGLPCAKGDEA
jgi:thiosulfate/3-mercaptopyruvate sulfurtransferase